MSLLKGDELHATEVLFIGLRTYLNAIFLKCT